MKRRDTDVSEAIEKVDAMEKNLAGAKVELERARHLRDAAYAARAAREDIMAAALAASPTAAVNAHGQFVTPTAPTSAPAKAEVGAGVATANGRDPRPLKRARGEGLTAQDGASEPPAAVEQAGEQADTQSATVV